MSSMLLRGVIRNGRVEVNQPINLPEGTEVVVTSGTTVLEDSPPTPAEITRVLTAMHQLLPFEIPKDVEADLDAWERELSRHGVEHTDPGLEDPFG